LKIVFHDKYFDVYSGDPASAEGRLDRAYGILKENFEFVQPEPARDEDLLLVHGQAHISHVEDDTHLFEVASLVGCNRNSHHYELRSIEPDNAL